MAIKISGTTVIDDSGNFTNIANTTATTLIGDGSQLAGVSKAVDVVTPYNVSPTDKSDVGTLTPTLEASQFISLFDRTHANTQFQVSIDSGFSNTEVDVFTGANTSLVTPQLSLLATEHFFRVRYFDDAGCCSCFSTATSFTSGNAIDAQLLGEAACGGFYMGTICAASTCYYLIMAPNATGCIQCCQYRTPNVSSGVGNELCDGYGNTYDHMVNAEHPAGNWTATRTIGGFSDWYLPAMNELFQLYNNCACTPAGEGFTDAGGGFTGLIYWSSTEHNASRACGVNLVNGSCGYIGKDSPVQLTRAIRREPFPS